MKKNDRTKIREKWEKLADGVTKKIAVDAYHDLELLSELPTSISKGAVLVQMARNYKLLCDFRTRDAKNPLLPIYEGKISISANELKDDEIRELVALQPEIINFLQKPGEEREQMWLAAIAREPRLIKSAPKGLQTESFRIEALKRNPQCFPHMDNPSPKVCAEAIMQDASLFTYVPKELQTEKLCFLAITAAPYNFLHIDRDKRTPALCDYVLKKDKNLIGYFEVDEIRSVWNFNAANKNIPQIYKTVFEAGFTGSTDKEFADFLETLEGEGEKGGSGGGNLAPYPCPADEEDRESGFPQPAADDEPGPDDDIYGYSVPNDDDEDDFSSPSP